MNLAVVWCPLSERVGTIETQYSICNALFSLPDSKILITCKYPSHSRDYNDTSYIALIPGWQLVLFWHLSRLYAGRLSVALISIMALARLAITVVNIKPSTVTFYTCIFPTPVLFLKLLSTLPLMKTLVPRVKVINFIQGTPSFCNNYITDTPRLIESKLRHFIYAHLYKYSDKIITSTPSLKNTLQSIIYPQSGDNSFRYTPSFIAVIPNGIITSDLYGVDRSNVLSVGSICNSKVFHLVFIGRLTYQKNVLTLIDSFVLAISSKVISSISTLTLIGSGDLDSFIKYSYGAVTQLRILGFQPNPWRLILPTSIVIVPSLWEEPGHVPIEALSRGYRTLVSTGCSFIDFIPDQYRAIVCFDPFQIDSVFCSLEQRVSLEFWEKFFLNIRPVMDRFTVCSFERSIQSLYLDISK